MTRINIFCKLNCNVYPCFRINKNEEFTCKRFNNILKKYSKEKELRMLENFNKKSIDEMSNFLNSDKFDIYSVGKDISSLEFLRNEMSFEK